MAADADIALIGLAVMGQNLILNMNDRGFKVVAHNRTTSKVDDFLAGEARGTQIVGAHSVEEMLGMLKRPRRVMLLVKAGEVVDAFIDKIAPHLEAGDVLIDGGNSLYTDTIRRCRAGGLVTAGSDAPAVPYGLGLHAELALLREAGLANDQVLRLATANAALALGLERDLGTLEVGKLADFVVLTGDPLTRIADSLRIEAVVKGGVWLERQELMTSP